jgi:general secretion pathway protein G
MCCKLSRRNRIDSRRYAKVVRRGFSLVELMVVIVIIGLLAGAVTISVRSYMAAARRNTAKMEISNIASAIDLYYDMEKKGYPKTEEGLAVLLQPSNSMADGYLKTKKLNDPWGRPYLYFVPGPEQEPFEVVSYGADGKEGGIGDNRDVSNLDLKD